MPRSLPVKTIEHVTDIAASPEAVWRVLRDVERYPEWNPLLRIERFPERVGERMAVTVKAGKRESRFKPTVLELEPERALVWKGRLLVPGLFDGVHELRVEPGEGGGSRFVHRETVRGMLVPLVGGILRDTDAGFAAMNEALRERVEAPLA